MRAGAGVFQGVESKKRGEGTPGTATGHGWDRAGWDRVAGRARATRTVPLPSLSNLSNASLHAVMSSCESVIFASRRRTEGASRTAGRVYKRLLANFLHSDSSFVESQAQTRCPGRSSSCPVASLMMITSHARQEKNIATLNRSRRLGLTADGTFSGF